MTDGEKKTITLHLKDGIEATFEVRGDSQLTLGDIIETLSDEKRDMMNEVLSDASSASMADDWPTPGTLPATPNTSFSTSGTSACPWCGQPIALSQATTAGIKPTNRRHR